MAAFGYLIGSMISFLAGLIGYFAFGLPLLTALAVYVLGGIFIGSALIVSNCMYNRAMKFRTNAYA